MKPRLRLPRLVHRLPGPALVVAVVALGVALGDGAMAAGLIDGRLLKPDSVSSAS